MILVSMEKLTIIKQQIRTDFFYGAIAPSGPGLLLLPRLHDQAKKTAPHLAELLWTSDRP